MIGKINLVEKGIKFLFSIILTVFIISITVKLVANLKQLYYYDINYLNIVEESGFDRNIIVENYDYIVEYLTSWGKSENFQLPSMDFSANGKVHFEDVKNIFNQINVLCLVTGGISIAGIYLNIKKRNFRFMKWTSCLLIILPIVLGLLIVIDFDNIFTVFHNIFFSNDYWIFDPKIDPVINILPSEFFMHAAILILFIMILFSIVLSVAYKKLDRK